MSSIPIYLIVGFLGSGKTTLLKRLVNATEGLHYLYVINEFSAVDVDAGQIEKEGGVAIAVAGGSIFCRCLISEFVSVMKKISAGVNVGGEMVQPGGVVIEASGMADPRSMSKLLAESRLDQSYHVAGVTAIVDPGVLVKLLLVLPNIKGQIQSADLILFNKIDLHSPEMVDSVTDRVRSINNNARVMHCTHCDVDPDLILKGGGSESLNLLDADYNKCKDPHYEREALAFKGKVALSDLVALFNGPLDGLYRVKGYVECNEGWYFVEWSEGGLSHQAALPQPTSTLTVIWNPAIDSLVVGQLRYLAF
ncbi:MAG: hypothetical protein PF904_10680 [Kiritimatiellae bacterium]|jgi:G3E family GTPase|nr:hypothetical protein [Kiritimatiellia bacterium]